MASAPVQPAIRKFFRRVRIAFSLAIMGFTILLVYWNRRHDPRFWAFLESRPGWVLAEVLRRSGKLPLPPGDITLTPAEEERRNALQSEVLLSWPTAQLTLTSGRVKAGHVEALSPGGVVFQEVWSSSETRALTHPWTRVQDLRPYPVPPPMVTARDVRFHQEQPKLRLFRFPPYTILSDEEFSRVAGYVQELERLEQRLRAEFGPLITRSNRVDGIQVVLFSDETHFRRYQKKYAPMMENTAGFYSTAIDRLVLYNQAGSHTVRDLRDSVSAYAQEYLDLSRSGANIDERTVRAAEAKMLRGIDQQSHQLSLRVLRHEGAHQLLHTLGVHSSFHAENPWLLEGLAVYCENEMIGSRAGDHLATLRAGYRDGHALPLSVLVNRRSPRGLLESSEGRAGSNALAYAQSWALVYHLMSKENRPGFESFIRFLRDRDHVWEVATTPQFDLLLRFLRTDENTLEHGVRAMAGVP